MIYDYCCIFVSLTETIVSALYFRKNLKPKKSSVFLTVSYGLLFFGLCTCTLTKSSLLSVVAFCLYNFILVLQCYETNFFTAMFHTELLLTFMSVSELITGYSLPVFIPLDKEAKRYYITNSFSGTQAVLRNDDNLLLIVYAVCAKLLYILSLLALNKMLRHNPTGDSRRLLLSLFPAGIIVSVATMSWAISYFEADPFFMFCISVSLTALLASDIIIFYIYEQSNLTRQKYTEITIENQRMKSSAEYYSLLREQNESSRILIHDIKRHLNSIKLLSSEENGESIKYINSILDDYGISAPINFSNIPILNLIIQRYSDICRKNNISFNVSVQGAKLGKMTEPDITALFDNLLENAVESARKSGEGFIDLSVAMRNTNFVVISVSNTCYEQPTADGMTFISAKKNPEVHGFGTKSIVRVVNKYNGSIKTDFQQTESIFSVKIIFQLH